MNKKLLSKRVVATVAAMSLIAVPLVAKPVMKKITAYLNPTISYAYDGDKILNGVNSITYENKTYVPVSEFTEALGKDLSYKNGKIIITSKVEDQKQIIIDKATIKEINKKDNQVAILPAGSEDRYENYIILNVGPNTLLRHEKIKIRVVLDDLKAGMEVKVAHSLLSTASLPSQTNAFDIMIYADNTEADTEDISQDHKISTGTVKEVLSKDKQVVILPAGKKDSYENYIVLNISDQTLVENKGKTISFKDLSVGMKVKAVHSKIATFSLPPQTPTYKIIVISKDKDNKEDEEYELEDAVIKEINHTEKYLIAVKKDKEYKVFFNEKTEVEFDNDDENENPTIKDLKVGQVVDIEAEDGVAEEIEIQN